jgi:4-carboxymuconolactone decarboxylase
VRQRYKKIFTWSLVGDPSSGYEFRTFYSAFTKMDERNCGERLMSVFDEDLFLKGLEQRKSTLGADYVEKNLAAADDFTRPFQEAMTAWCWGFGWGDEVIPAKTRSMMNLSMIGALGKMHEWEIHCKGALNNGVSKEEIRAIIHVIGIYCGVPQALECFRVAKRVVDQNE